MDGSFVLTAKGCKVASLLPAFTLVSVPIRYQLEVQTSSGLHSAAEALRQPDLHCSLDGEWML